MYGYIVVSVRLDKEETYRTRLTVGDNLLKNTIDVIIHTAKLTTVKV